MIEYPICPKCKKQTVAGACLTSSEPPKRSLYCTSGSCDYDVKFEDLTTPILKTPDGDNLSTPTTEEER